jgi:hypothetical protein
MSSSAEKKKYFHVFSPNPVFTAKGYKRYRNAGIQSYVLSIIKACHNAKPSFISAECSIFYAGMFVCDKVLATASQHARTALPKTTVSLL